MRQFCIQCGESPGQTFRPFCQCGGMVDVEYDLKKVTLHPSENPYVRFADLLPIQNTHDCLPPDATFTPTVHAKKLGAKLGMPSLFLKNETRLPTCSTKYRMAVVSLAYLWEFGVRTFCTSSTGNSSTAYALAIRSYPDMSTCIFTAESFISRVQHADHDQVKNYVLRDATFVDAFNAAAAFARQNALVSESGFFNPGRREGLKLAFLEACEQIPTPIDWYVQAVSSAMGVYGTWKGAKEVLALGQTRQLPRLLCVQQSQCAPMADAYREGSHHIQPHHIVARPNGIAEAILRGNPTRTYPFIRRIVQESMGDMVAVDDHEIREARQMVEELEGLSPCFSASTAVAGLIKQARHGRVPLKDTVMINLTGGERTGGLPPTEMIWLKRRGANWAEE